MQSRQLLPALAFMASALAGPLPVPQESPPAGCVDTYSGTFQLIAYNVSSVGKRSPAKLLSLGKRSEAAVLTCRLENGQLIDQDGRLAYIASNHQFQFDTSPQHNARTSGGFSICSGNYLAMGSSTTFYQCWSGGFWNIYSSHWAPQCSAINLVGSEDATDANPVAQIPDGQPQITPGTGVSPAGPTAVSTGVPIPPNNQSVVYSSSLSYARSSPLSESDVYPTPINSEGLPETIVVPGTPVAPETIVSPPPGTIVVPQTIVESEFITVSGSVVQPTPGTIVVPQTIVESEIITPSGTIVAPPPTNTEGPAGPLSPQASSPAAVTPIASESPAPVGPESSAPAESGSPVASPSRETPKPSIHNIPTAVPTSPGLIVYQGPDGQIQIYPDHPSTPPSVPPPAQPSAPEGSPPAVPATPQSPPPAVPATPESSPPPVPATPQSTPPAAPTTPEGPPPAVPATPEGSPPAAPTTSAVPATPETIPEGSPPAVPATPQSPPPAVPATPEATPEGSPPPVPSTPEATPEGSPPPVPAAPEGSPPAPPATPQAPPPAVPATPIATEPGVAPSPVEPSGAPVGEPGPVTEIPPAPTSGEPIYTGGAARPGFAVGPMIAGIIGLVVLF